MRFCYYTNLVIGIVLCILELAVIVSSIGTIALAAESADNPYTVGVLVGQLFGLSLFGTMAVLLLVSARKIKLKMKEDAREASFLNS